MPRLVFSSLLLLLLTLAGCGSPSYAGGPTDDDPHAIVIPGDDVTIWRVDGQDVPARSSTARLAPGRRAIRVRYNFPIESDAALPFGYEDLSVTIEEGRIYLIERTGEGPFGPYGVEMKVSPR